MLLKLMNHENVPIFKHFQDSNAPDPKRLLTNNKLKGVFDRRVHITKRISLKENIPQKRNTRLEQQSTTKGKFIMKVVFSSSS